MQLQTVRRQTHGKIKEEHPQTSHERGQTLLSCHSARPTRGLRRPSLDARDGDSRSAQSKEERVEWEI